MKLRTTTIYDLEKITNYMQKNAENYYIFATASCDTSNSIHTGTYKHLVICEDCAVLFKKNFHIVASVHEALLYGLIDVIASIKQKRKIFIIAGVNIGLKSFISGISRNSNLLRKLIEVAKEKAIELTEVYLKNDIKNMKIYIDDIENGYITGYSLKKVIEKEQQL